MNKSPLPKILPVLVFILGLSLAMTTALGLENASDKSSVMLFPEEGVIEAAIAYDSVRPRPLTLAEKRAGEIAWTYFVNNTNPKTGLVNAANNFPSATFWEQGSYMMAMISAKRLGVISQDEFNKRSVRLLIALEHLPLVAGKFPNKVYNTNSLKMTDYTNKPTDVGLGWSALDSARVTIGLVALATETPALSSRITGLLRRWNMDQITKNGELQGATVIDGELVYLQEGRLGYEQYGARGAGLIGLDIVSALGSRDKFEWRKIGSIDIPIDKRSFEKFESITPVSSEPYILSALEFGFDAESGYLGRQIYLAQKERYEDTGILTAVSEDHINKPPYFIYSGVYANGEDWAVTNESGKFFNEFRILSTKAAFAWDAIYDDDYGKKMMAAIAPLADPKKGWQAGIYEVDGKINTATVLNTNAVILEALHYRAFGPILNPKVPINTNSIMTADNVETPSPEQEMTSPEQEMIRTAREIERTANDMSTASGDPNDISNDLAKTARDLAEMAQQLANTVVELSRYVAPLEIDGDESAGSSGEAQGPAEEEKTENRPVLGRKAIVAF